MPWVKLGSAVRSGLDVTTQVSEEQMLTGAYDRYGIALQPKAEPGPSIQGYGPQGNTSPAVCSRAMDERVIYSK
ncbi:MAG TPA: hypothetical protein VE954_12920 [Oligoflexus sp.]|uniref:hypothetical protein n=1 Tax=Oligoflexus sp. TaxID=1971216 RepID=UPI002D44DA19|nr:hypothetical protein [Oligoflexus sp.]HYX34011.1 hypothetical protein [Oligoflexus sp.]